MLGQSSVLDASQELEHREVISHIWSLFIQTKLHYQYKTINLCGGADEWLQRALIREPKPVFDTYKKWYGFLLIFFIILSIT